MLRRLRRRIRSRDAADPSDPRSEWHVPSGPGPVLVVTEIADLALLQGIRPSTCAPDGASIELDGEAGSRTVSITRWFAVPDSPHPDPLAFAVTLDEVDMAGATRCRLHCGDAAGPWQPLPELHTPQGMPGVEALSECPACANYRRTIVGRRQGLQMQRCTGCGLVMTSPRPAEDKTLVRYSRSYFEHEYLPSQSDTPSLRAHNDALLDALEPHLRPGSTLFELGIGGGLLLDRAVERGWTVAGTDVNETAVEHVRARGHDVWADNIDHADTIGGPYTAVLSEMSLEHLRRPDHAVRLAADALEPGGVLLIYTVSPDGESFRHAGMASYLVGPAEHLFLFSEASLAALCEGAGLRVEHHWNSASGDDVGIVAVKPA